MKILSVNNTSDLYGASRCMERLFRQFVLAGHEVHAVLPGTGPLVALLRSSGVQVHIQPGISIVDRARMRTAWGVVSFAVSTPLSVLRLAWLIGRLRIDVVHTNTVVMPTPAFAAYLMGVPHVWHVREILSEFEAFWRPFQHVVTGLSNSVIAVSQSVRQQFLPGLQHQVTVIYDGLGDEAATVNEAYRTALRERFCADALLVGVVGRIKFHRKGQEILVQAVSLLKGKYPEARFLVVGSPPPRSPDELGRLSALMEECGVRERFTLLGEIDDPASLFAALDITVVPSVHPEPFGCVVIEAMAVGTPVIGSDCGGIAEQIVDGQTGLLFKPGDAAALAIALDRMLSDADLRYRMSQQASIRMKTCFRTEDTFLATNVMFQYAMGTTSIRNTGS
ncbi:glycosyltransferase [Terriglobus roseus]|uniref:glycosyltransferase n=1 Tax=Terriglobus roseus TaxID=392734 RepID=UPI00147EBF10|nr:glycosyltransferase [Terriglobus roseus]